jgi:hypothetical protein
MEKKKPEMMVCPKAEECGDDIEGCCERAGY